MSRRSVATVRILRRPDIHPDAVRVEIDCKHSTTGLTHVPGPTIDMSVQALITAACFAHEERCEGDCDTSQAHAQGHRAMRDETERVYATVQAERTRRYAASRRN